MTIATVLTVSETLRELRETPSGPLYASLMSLVPGLTFEGYMAILATLKRAGLIDERAHVLRWVGPGVAPFADLPPSPKRDRTLERWGKA